MFELIPEAEQNPFEKKRDLPQERIDSLVQALLNIDLKDKNAKQQIRKIVVEAHPDRHPEDKNAEIIAKAGNILLMQVMNPKNLNPKQVNEAYDLLISIDQKFQHESDSKTNLSDVFSDYDFWNNVHRDWAEKRRQRNRAQRTENRNQKKQNQSTQPFIWDFDNFSSINKQLKELVKTKLSDIFLERFDNKSQINDEDILNCFVDAMEVLLRSKTNDPKAELKSGNITIETRNTKRGIIDYDVSLLGKEVFTYSLTSKMGNTKGNISNWNEGNLKKGLKRLLKYYKPR
jgi:hypothetical protein